MAIGLDFTNDSSADDQPGLAAAMAGLSSLVAGSRTLEQLLTEVAGLAILATPGADGAGVTVLEPRQPTRTVASEPFAREIDPIQYRLGEGPCTSAAATRRTTTSRPRHEDGAAWPGIRGFVAGPGIHSTISLPLIVKAEVIGALDLYATAPNTFCNSSRSLGEQFAGPAAVAIYNARLFDQAQRTVARLDQALTNRPDIDRAVVESRAEVREAERVRADVALRSSGGGVWDWDLSTGKMSWDKRMIALYGYHGEDHAFTDAASAALAGRHPDDPQFVGSSLVAASAQIGPIHWTHRIVVPPGEVRWLEVRGEVLPDPAGVAGRMIGVSWDITAARRSEARAANVVSGMPIGFEALDTQWNVTALNAEAARLIGVPAQRLIGRNLWAEFPSLVGSEFETVCRRVANTRRAEMLADHYSHRLGSWYEMRITADELGVVVYVLDVSVRHEAQARAAQVAATARDLAELGRSQEQMAAFAGQVSHDLRNPLAAIVGFNEMLSAVPAIAADDTAASYVSRIASSSRRMMQTMNRLLDYAAVGGELHKRFVTPAEVMPAVLEDLQPVIAGAAVTWTGTGVTADPVQLRLLLQNLVGNALKYRHPDRVCAVAVSVSDIGGDVELSVVDNGIGIPAENRIEALRPFSRLNYELPGTGLGLATCARIVTAHGASIRIGDTHGGGTTVSIRFPR